MIFLLSQLPLEAVTGHVLRELNQVPAGGECPSRPWRARAKSDLQLGGPEHRAALPPHCQGALALCGVLRRLQLVEEQILQVKPPLCLASASRSPSPCACAEWAPPPPAVHVLSPVLCVASETACLPALPSLVEVTFPLSVTTSFFFLLSHLDCRRGLRTWPTGNFTKRTLRTRRLTLPPCLDTGISRR